MRFRQGRERLRGRRFRQDTKYFGDEPKQAMINYRVDDMDALLAKLEAAGVWIDPNRQDEVYGKFAWIKDCDGNRVELWEPLALAEETPA